MAYVVKKSQFYFPAQYHRILVYLQVQRKELHWMMITRPILIRSGPRPRFQGLPHLLQLHCKLKT